MHNDALHLSVPQQYCVYKQFMTHQAKILVAGVVGWMECGHCWFFFILVQSLWFVCHETITFGLYIGQVQLWDLAAARDR
ncbi:hypothetical protein ACA910_020355 [Epithemia clementina (nom. ined.)]